MAEEEFDFRKAYGIVKEKHPTLPDFEVLDNEFELSSIKDFPEKERFLLRNIRRKVYDRLVGLSQFIEGLLNPNTGSLVSMAESQQLSKGDREKVKKVLDRLMIMERNSFIIEVDLDDKKSAEFIKEALDAWVKAKKDMEPIFKILMKAWMPEDVKNDNHYFG